MMAQKYETMTRRQEILLVEDDLADIKLMKRAMASLSLEGKIHVVRDGVEAMQFLRREEGFEDAPRPDLILLDLQMPRKNGRETLKEIKSDPELSTIPVVVVTTSAAEADVEYSYSQHANSYITKPVELAQFKQAVEAINAYWLSIVRLPKPG